MKKKRLLVIIIFIFIVLGFVAYFSDDKNEQNANQNNLKNEQNIIYNDDAGIQKFISMYNTIYPQNRIEKDMINKYYHHGREHDSQIQFTLNDNEIIISDLYNLNNKYRISVFIKPKSDNEITKNDFFKFVKIFNSSLTDNELENYWSEQASNEYSFYEKIGNVKCQINKYNYTIEYIKIEGDINE